MDKEHKKCNKPGCKSLADSYNNNECKKHAFCICEVSDCNNTTQVVSHKCDNHDYRRYILECAIQKCFRLCLPWHNVCKHHYINLFRIDIRDIVSCCRNDPESLPTFHYLCLSHTLCKYPACEIIIYNKNYCLSHSCYVINCTKSNKCKEHIRTNTTCWYGMHNYLSTIPGDVLLILQSLLLHNKKEYYIDY